MANLAVYFSLLKPGDKIMGLELASGGHLTKHFKTVSNEYLGATREIQEKMEKMKNEHENELLKKDMEILKLQHEKENYKNMYEYTLKEKENKDEIYKLQIENYKLQLQLNNK